MLLFGFAPSAGWFLVACLVWGVAIAIGGAAPAAYAADSAPPGLNATTMSVYRMAGDAGYVAGPMLRGLLADWQGPEATMIVAAMLLAAMGLLFAVVAPETYRRR